MEVIRKRGYQPEFDCTVFSRGKGTYTLEVPLIFGRSQLLVEHIAKKYLAKGSVKSSRVNDILFIIDYQCAHIGKVRELIDQL